ncbi:MAG: LPXTG cell wall anchor domain-containing protein, partial [Litorilinea sp.]
DRVRTMVTIDAVNATESGWLVVHLDQDGRPGAVIGQTAVPTGDTQNVVVFLDEAISGETVLWAMLHVDAGEAGVYEFPGADVPARIDDDIVMTAFTVSAPAAAVPEMTPTPVAEAEAEMAEPTATPAAEEEGEDDEEMMAPTSLPATGGGMTGAPLAISVAALFLLGLAAVTLRKRRHLV